MGVYPGCKGQFKNQLSVRTTKPNQVKKIIKNPSPNPGIKKMKEHEDSGGKININYLIMGGLGVIIVILLVK